MVATLDFLHVLSLLYVYQCFTWFVTYVTVLGTHVTYVIKVCTYVIRVILIPTHVIILVIRVYKCNNMVMLYLFIILLSTQVVSELVASWQGWSSENMFS